MTTIYPLDYGEKLKKYNKMVAELAEKRKRFYEENPNFHFKSMYINVYAPPIKITIREVKDKNKLSNYEEKLNSL